MTDLDERTMHLLRKSFATHDKTKSGFISTNELESILTTMGQTFEPEDLQEAIRRVDQDQEGKVNFENFLHICSAFMEEDDDETITNELREAFRLYDKEGVGYITTKTLSEILKELDSKLTAEDLDEIIADIDQEKTGKIDFEHFKALMI